MTDPDRLRGGIIKVYSGEFGLGGVIGQQAFTVTEPTREEQTRDFIRSAAEVAEQFEECWENGVVTANRLWVDALPCDDPDCPMCDHTGAVFERSSPLRDEDEGDTMGAESDPCAMGAAERFFRRLREE